VAVAERGERREQDDIVRAGGILLHEAPGEKRTRHCRHWREILGIASYGHFSGWEGCVEKKHIYWRSDPSNSL